MRAVWKGVTIAESDDTVVIEGNHYFPPESVRFEHLRPTWMRTICPWKGVARYYTITAGGGRGALLHDHRGRSGEQERRLDVPATLALDPQDQRPRGVLERRSGGPFAPGPDA